VLELAILTLEMLSISSHRSRNWFYFHTRTSKEQLFDLIEDLELFQDAQTRQFSPVGSDRERPAVEDHALVSFKVIPSSSHSLPMAMERSQIHPAKPIQ
jgi:hypothetical protein